MPAGFRPPGAPQRTRQPRVRSRLRSEESAKNRVPAAVRLVNERSDMIAPVMVMAGCIAVAEKRGKPSFTFCLRSGFRRPDETRQRHHQTTRDQPPESPGNAGE